MSNRTKRNLGFILFGVGVALTAVLAFGQGGMKPPSRSLDAVFVILISLSQGGAALAFRSIGRADPMHAQRSAARLVGLANRTEEAGSLAQTAFEQETGARALHVQMGIVSVHFDWIVDQLTECVEDWRVFYPELVANQKEENEDDG
jgi:hypothetical protein